MCFTKKYSRPGIFERGFTLIELSISLVIIGLIVGGILGARDLIQQATLRGVIKDIESYKTMSNTFNLKYAGLPGDLRNAQSYWPSCTNSGANLCNGDGDSRIEFADPVDGSVREDQRSWQHLTLSGIMPGSYLGAGADSFGVGGTNPAAPIDGAGYVYTYGTVYSRPGNYIRMNTNVPVGSGASLSPPDAKSIDDKIDDGVYNTGHVYSTNALAGDMSTLTCISSGAYLLTTGDLRCRIYFWLD